MTLYYITQEQLDELQVLVWGARMTKPEEPQKFADLISLVRQQQGIADGISEIILRKP